MTAAQGRCDGCRENGPLVSMNRHIGQCDAWAELFRKDPAGPLDPGQAYARWAEQDRTAERAADLQGRVADTVRRRTKSEDRFRAIDPLGDP